MTDTPSAAIQNYLQKNSSEVYCHHAYIDRRCKSKRCLLRQLKETAEQELKTLDALNMQEHPTATDLRGVEFVNDIRTRPASTLNEPQLGVVQSIPEQYTSKVSNIVGSRFGKQSSDTEKNKKKKKLQSQHSKSVTCKHGGDDTPGYYVGGDIDPDMAAQFINNVRVNDLQAPSAYNSNVDTVGSTSNEGSHVSCDMHSSVHEDKFYESFTAGAGLTPEEKHKSASSSEQDDSQDETTGKTFTSKDNNLTFSSALMNKEREPNFKLDSSIGKHFDQSTTDYGTDTGDSRLPVKEAATEGSSAKLSSKDGHILLENSDLPVGRRSRSSESEDENESTSKPIAANVDNSKQ